MTEDVVQIEVHRDVREAFKKYLLLRYQCQRGKMREEVDRALVEYLRHEMGEETTDALLGTPDGLWDDGASGGGASGGGASGDGLPGVDAEPVNAE